MEIKISSANQIPIYEQIENQIKELIMNGVYTPGTQLPSIRILARELKVGIITCRRAYDDLCDQGILVSHPGKGIFVAEVMKEQIKDMNMEMITHQLKEMCEYARASGIDKTEIIEQINRIFKEMDK